MDEKAVKRSLEEDEITSYAILSDIANMELSKMGSMKVFSSAEELCLSRGYLTPEQAKQVNVEVRKLMKSNGPAMDFPLIAYEKGFLKEKQAISAITAFKTIEIVRTSEVSKHQPIFDTFPLRYCRKRRFFEYRGEQLDINYFFVSVTASATFADAVKRYIPSGYKARFALPQTIDKMLDEAEKNAVCMEGDNG